MLEGCGKSLQGLRPKIPKSSSCCSLADFNLLSKKIRWSLVDLLVNKLIVIVETSCLASAFISESGHVQLTGFGGRVVWCEKCLLHRQLPNLHQWGREVEGLFSPRSDDDTDHHPIIRWLIPRCLWRGMFWFIEHTLLSESGEWSLKRWVAFSGRF